MRKFISLAVVFVLVILGVWFIRNRGADEIPSGSGTPETNAVIYTDQGYSPATLTVKAGTSVIFKNQSTGQMWTASAVHPTHTILPEFDPKTGTPPQASYSFTFLKAGTWKYHNHLKPNHGGTVIVE